MLVLLSVFWDIALWRRGPRDLPPSPLLLMASAVAYVATSAVQSYLMYGPALVMARAWADLAVTVLVFAACLALARRGHRLLQTLIALLGTGSLLALPMLAVLLVGAAFGNDGFLGLVLSLVSLPLMIWYLFVVGHIVRLALEAPLFTGMAVAMTYFLVSYVALVQLPPLLGD